MRTNRCFLQLVVVAFSSMTTGCAFVAPEIYRSMDLAPGISPDGSLIAFLSRRATVENPDGHQHVWLMNADGSQARCLLPLNGHEGPPTWTASGDAIWFFSGAMPDEAANRKGWLLVSRHGEILERVPLRASLSGTALPHPDGVHVIVIRDKALWLADRRKGKARRVSTFSEMWSATPAWSRAVYCAREHDGHWLYLVEPATGQIRRLCQGVFPHMRADGRAVVFTRRYAGDILSVDCDHEVVRQLTEFAPGEAGRSPRYSADGSEVVFSFERRPADAHRSVSGIATISAGGGAFRELTSDVPNAHRGEYFPDGRSVLFVGGPRRNLGLYTVPSDGSSPARRLSPDYPE